MEKKYSITIGGQEMIFETGKVAKQASGSIVATYGETVILTTACITDSAREGIDFFPLLVDFEERFYSAGKIPGGFIKREGRPSETAILSARVIDRSIRSLFDEDLRNDVHVVATVLAVDQINPPNILAINAASAALTISDIPWAGPVGAVRIGLIDGNLVVNPVEELMANSSLDLIVSGHADGITMVEAGANEVPEEILVDAIELAHSEILKIVQLQMLMREEIGLPKKEILTPVVIEEIDNWLKTELEKDIFDAVKIHQKQPRSEKIRSVTDKAIEHFAETLPGNENYIRSGIEKMVKKCMRSVILDEKIRVDGRKMDEVRPVTCEVDVLPRVHGSALFTRGETQSLATTTLGMLGQDDQILDGLKEDEPNKRFLLHYNFPPYSVGEVRPMRGPGRREIGHGALAERALKPMIPSEEEFPYVMRVVSDILESNGSSSQASICGGSLSLMSAGVPIKKHVAGVAMGLIKEGDKVEILTDIQGLEDHYGDMDFKVAGTRDGVTALQMDNKAGGITREILQTALSQAKKGRFHILSVMEESITQAAELSPNAPRIHVMNIDPEKIRDLIGPGGKTIKGIIQKTGVKMNVEDSGEVYISAPEQETLDEAISMVVALTKDVQAGEIYLGTVTRLMNFGAFVEVLPGKEGLLHISEVSKHRLPKIEDAFKVGDTVLVMVKEIDEMKRVNLSRRRLLQDEKAVIEAGFEDQLPSEMERDKAFETLSEKSGGSSRPSGSRGDHSKSDNPRHRSGRPRHPRNQG
jgi:polyribonucleotide nucleotidyltransferase